MHFFLIELFLLQVFYHYNIVQQLKALYLSIYTPSQPDHEGEAKSKKPDDKGRKEKSGKEKKETGKKVNVAADDVRENTTGKNSFSLCLMVELMILEVSPPIEQNIPPWDLSLDTLQKVQ